jgi:crotonobetainyl-CoA:carnitine CoA-transferase CaiB-like acyl-CoA transferase
MLTDVQPHLPLADFRVLDLSDGICESTGRILADLGADVIKVEPADGAPSRRDGLVEAGISLTFVAANANKRSVVVDFGTSAGRGDLVQLVSSADLMITGGPGSLELPPELAPATLAEKHATLVVMELSWFGKTGPYSQWVGSPDVLAAMSGLLAKSGLPGREPLLPPEHLADAAASSHAAWTATMALWKVRRTGMGELIDFAAFEGVAVSLDPVYGISGTARGAAADLPHGRPDARHLYPMFTCADGWVRICLLSARQWSNMLDWMGHPDVLSDPKYSVLQERFRAAKIINPQIGTFFATLTRAQIVQEGEKYGVPAAGLLSPQEVLTTPHYIERQSFVEIPTGSSQSAKMPRGYFEIDGEYIGCRTSAPAVGEHSRDVVNSAKLSVPAAPTSHGDDRPFEGIRVLDLGVIVAGAEAGRLFADWGADVIKVESREFPDGSRQGTAADEITPSFSWGHRNKRSLGLNLRSPRGREIFLDLVKQSDVMLSNFKPGTLEKLELDHETLAAVNPRLITADSSAFGTTGPWSRRMGYGPLVRASTGLSLLWSYPGDENGFSDAITIYPDHVAARFVAIAAIALLIRRETTGVGGTASVAQTDVLLGQMADRVMAESLRPGYLGVAGNSRGGDSPRGIFPCLGDDEWCVIDVRDDAQFRGLASAIEMPEWVDGEGFGSSEERLSRREHIEGKVRSWTSSHAPREAMTILQEHGVPCGMMQRASELRDDPQFASRGFLDRQTQPQLEGELITQNGEAVFSTMGLPQFGPAPLQGEHTVSIATEIFGMSASAVADLEQAGVLEPWPSLVASGER